MRYRFYYCLNFKLYPPLLMQVWLSSLSKNKLAGYEMNHRELTKQEQEYLSNGGRVFVVGKSNEVFMLKGEAGDHIHSITDNDGNTITYETFKMALDTAQMIASLSEDQPMVEGEIINWQ